ncbi:MAG: methylmalonyl-CoA carboxyltransferase [Cyanobacteria bacterium RYN_339]|nr:methylmalonyl-CoA carboxyltransferase [Cyanobacteria bacterium RYN_339]
MEYQDRHAAAETPGDPRMSKRLQRMGHLGVRERLERLFDAGTFTEWGRLVAATGDGVVTGYGKVEGRLVFAYAQDYTVQEGTTGALGAKKVCDLLDRAAEVGAPVVSLLHSNGARVEEGYGMLEGITELFYRIVRYSGVIPQLTAVMGVAAGVPAYMAALNDLCFMVDDISFAMVTSPAVIKVSTGEEVGLAELGGAEMHAGVSGFAHARFPDEAACLAGLREAIAYLPANNSADAPHAAARPAVAVDWERLVPEDPYAPFDMHELVAGVLDGGRFFELHREFGPSALTGFGRIEGRPVGVVANQPLVQGGALDSPASRKIARFVRLCDAYNLPLVFFVDVPGFLPGKAQEQAGILLHGAMVLSAFETDVPRLSVVVRKCYGGAYVMLNSKACGGDLVLAYPQARIGATGAEAAFEMLHRKAARQAPDPAAFKAEKIAEFQEHYESVYAAAGQGVVDRVILPADTRRELASALEVFQTKRVLGRPPKRLCNIPL